MQSNGGTAALAFVAERPATLIESGPAGRRDRRRRGRARDRRGERALVRHGRHDRESRHDRRRRRRTSPTSSKRPARRTAAARAKAAAIRCASRSSTSPRSAPAAERSRGSMTVGVLRVGPLSAGADPGPACYGKGDAADRDRCERRARPAQPGRAGRRHASRSTPRVRGRRSRAWPRRSTATSSVPRPGIVALVDAEMAQGAAHRLGRARARSARLRR